MNTKAWVAAMAVGLTAAGNAAAQLDDDSVGGQPAGLSGAEKMGCSGKDGCGGKDGCKAKDEKKKKS